MKIKISHLIKVDKCIANEIRILNNKHGIITKFCCCGHGKDDMGYINVDEESEAKMRKLGYKLAEAGTQIITTVWSEAALGKYYKHGQPRTFYMECTYNFQPKSKCTCRRK